MGCVNGEHGIPDTVSVQIGLELRQDLGKTVCDVMMKAREHVEVKF